MRNIFDKHQSRADYIGDLLDSIENSSKQGLLGSTQGYNIAALESWNDMGTATALTDQLFANKANLESLLSGGSHAHALESFLTGTGTHSSLPGDHVREHQRKVALELASYALEAARNPMAYFEKIQDNLKATLESTDHGVDYFADFTSGPRAAAMGISNQFALEAFENNNLSSALSMSVVYNLATAVQDPAIELLFKTIVMDPDQVAVFYEVAIDRYWRGFQHDAKSRVNGPFEKLTTMQAIRRPHLLQEDVLDIVPFYQEKGENKNVDLFMPKEVMKPRERLVAGIPIMTNPLKVGLDYNLLQISHHPGLANGGVFDETDTLDSMLAIDYIYLSLTDNDADGVIELPTAGLERRNFIKSVQGHGMEMDLSFLTSEFTLTKATLDTLGRHSEKLKAITDADYSLRLTVEARGTANVESGHMRIIHAAAKVHSAHKTIKGKDGQRDIYEKVDLEKDATLKGLLAALDLKVKYFTPEANRTNTNIRTLGLLLDRDVFTAKYALGIRSPIRYQRKVGSKESSQDIIEALIRFSRIRQSADGWYELFRYRDTLKAYQNNEMRDDTRIPDFMGVGKVLVNPYYKHVEIDLHEVIKSAESKNNLDNVREYIVAVMQELAAEALVSSNWLIAAAQQNDGNAVDPHFGIVCGQYIPLVLSLRGDLRLMGQNFGHTIKTTQNIAMDERIFMTIVNPDAKGIDALSFGNTFVYPDIVVSISPHSVNGAVRETFIVQQRYQHIPNLPILIEITLKGLKEVIHNYNLVRVELSKDNAPLAGAKPAAAALPGVGGVGA